MFGNLWKGLVGGGALGCFGGGVWLCSLARRCGSDVEAVFRSARLSRDLLPNGLDAEWSTCWNRLLVGDVRGWGRALWYYSQRLWLLEVFTHPNDCATLLIVRIGTHTNFPTFFIGHPGFRIRLPVFQEIGSNPLFPRRLSLSRNPSNVVHSAQVDGEPLPLVSRPRCPGSIAVQASEVRRSAAALRRRRANLAVWNCTTLQAKRRGTCGLIRWEGYIWVGKAERYRFLTWATPRKHDVTSGGQRSLPRPCNSVKVEIEFPPECRLRF